MRDQFSILGRTVVGKTRMTFPSWVSLGKFIKPFWACLLWGWAHFFLKIVESSKWGYNVCKETNTAPSLYQSHIKLWCVQADFNWLVNRWLKFQESLALVGSLKSVMVEVQTRPFLLPGELVAKHLRAHSWWQVLIPITTAPKYIINLPAFVNSPYRIKNGPLKKI